MSAKVPPAVGDAAPEFTLPAAPDRKKVSLADFRGKPVVLYFYPRDMTPGCTTQACDFRDANDDFDAAGATVLGISPDSVEKHNRFIGAHDLPFTLLADEDRKVCNLYGVWVEKTNYGKKSMGIARTTFLIDADGTIAEIWPNVRVAGHVAKVLERVGRSA